MTKSAQRKLKKFKEDQAAGRISQTACIPIVCGLSKDKGGECDGSCNGPKPETSDNLYEYKAETVGGNLFELAHRLNTCDNENYLKGWEPLFAKGAGFGTIVFLRRPKQ